MSEQKPAPPPKPLEQADDTTIGTQPWAAWIVAALGVILVVIVVYLALERASEMARRQAVVAMTPMVGGMVIAESAPTVATGSAPATSVPQITAALGATVVETQTPAATAAAETTGAPPTEEATATVAEEAPMPGPTPLPATATPRPAATGGAPAITPALFAPGARVISSAARLTLFADATLAAPVLDAVTAGSMLTVMEPSGDYTGYPVLREGHSWVRVRAADGLVGWVIADNLKPAP